MCPSMAPGLWRLRRASDVGGGYDRFDLGDLVAVHAEALAEALRARGRVTVSGGAGEPPEVDVDRVEDDRGVVLDVPLLVANARDHVHDLDAERRRDLRTGVPALAPVLDPPRV